MFMDEDEKIDIAKLNQMYNEAEEADRDVFAEMRSNLNLIIGKHYNSVKKGLERNLRGKDIPQKVKLRLVENHTQRAISDIRDILASMTPGVLPYPANENEASSQKAAELAKAVWNKIKEQNDYEDFVSDTRQSFTDIGECCAKIYFDPLKGGIKGYEQKVNEFGEPLFIDQSGMETTEAETVNVVTDPLTGIAISQKVIPNQLAKDETKPIFRGQIVLKKFEPYNLLRPKSCKKLKDAPYLIYRDMVDVEEVKARVKQSDQISDERKAEILENIDSSGQSPFKVFDGTSGSYQDSQGQVEIREHYFRQSPKYPKGRFFITTDKDILFQDELPFGEDGEIAFPIVWGAFLTFQASCRGFSTVKHIRPAQAEVNRLASSQAETSITLGPDKVLLHQGGKFSRGLEYGGIRQMYYSGEKPTIIPGRSGEQYVPQLERAVDNIYSLAKIPENANPSSQNFDPKAELFKNQKQKARFTEPQTRFASFLKECCTKALFFAQKYLDEEDLVSYVGRTEAVNLAEFKNIDRMNLSIKMAEVSDDIDSMMAKQIELETILQYRGKELDNETAAILISQFPVLNKTQALKHLTLTQENIQSDILALDRGEYPPIHRYDDHEAYIKHLTHRMKQKDFLFLSPKIQQNYERRMMEHEQFIARAAEELQRAQAGFIPTGGALVKADMYINPDPSNPEKKERAVFSTESLQWLLEKTREQGLAQDRLMEIANQQAAAEIAQMAMQQTPQNMGMIDQGGTSGFGKPTIPGIGY